MLNLGYRDAVDRHRSLRACVEWSYQLCTDVEQRFWARSSVFTGGFDLAAAEAVCGADDLPAGEILDLVSALVDQSVVLAEEAADGHTRYRMLTDIRQFGLEQAEKDGELHGMQERHATWCAELVSRFDDEACGPRQADWLRRAPAGAREPAGRPRVLRRGTPRLPRPAWSWPGSSTCTGPPPGCSTRHATGWRSTLASGAGTPQERAIALAVAARFAVLQNDRLRARELIDEGTEAGRRRR